MTKFIRLFALFLFPMLLVRCTTSSITSLTPSQQVLIGSNPEVIAKMRGNKVAVVSDNKNAPPRAANN